MNLVHSQKKNSVGFQDVQYNSFFDEVGLIVFEDVD